VEFYPFFGYCLFAFSFFLLGFLIGKPFFFPLFICINSTDDLENALMAHEAVLEASVIAVPHDKWQERPVACVVLKDQYKDKIKKEELYEFLMPQFAKWWLPDDILFLDEIPKTSVGKFLKRALRDQLKDYLVPKA
jgi:fatty-acyl-CoA synthase